MATQFIWRDDYNIGVELIDQEHQRLFRILNRLFEAREGDERGSQWACQEGIKYFQGHAVKHFMEEEGYMLSINYDGFDRHRRIHKSFREDTLPALEQELKRTGYSPEAMDHFLGVCSGWLVGHTLLEDRAIVGENVSPWKNLLPDGELAALKRVIEQLVFDMFQLKPRVVSDTYGGEKFGKGIYYRMVYGTAGKRQEILMAFEEELLLNTVGKIMTDHPEKTDTVLVNTSRYTAKQFVGRLLEHFPSMKDYELLEENLLTYNEFQQIFAQKAPQISLLLSTGGAGYFAYCVFAPHIAREGIGTPIGHENALEEVGRYLEQVEQEQASSKKKVLVVDDSQAMRNDLKALLEKDYEVLTAGSGAGAIRAITLDRPDLVLLDYDMPVCDGPQTLGMLRAEEEFANIPVIFLSGRRERESMIQVMPLRPAGYLLEGTKLADIQEEVTKFFQQQ